jgi:hypothetical protein
MGYLILAPILLLLVMLVAPLTLGYDSGKKWLQIKWLGLSLTTRLEGGKPKKLWQGVTKNRTRRGGAVVPRLWKNRDLCLELIHRVWRFILEIFRTLSFRDSEVRISLPDPMWNGLLFAVVSNIHLEDMDLSVNFENRNFAKIWVTVYPYRVIRQMATLLLHLPYIKIIGFARTCKTACPDRKSEAS